MKINVNQLAKMGVLAALSLVLMLLVRFPIIPAASFLEYEPADVPILICGFFYGPVAGLIVTAVVSIIQAITVSAGSGWIGALMHFIATGAFVLVAGNIYKRKHSIKGAVIALAAGIITMTLVMIPLNLYFTTKFMGAPLEVVKAMLLPAIIPFNLIKGGINSVLVMLVYKSVGKILRKNRHSDAVKKDEFIGEDFK